MGTTAHLEGQVRQQVVAHEAVHSATEEHEVGAAAALELLPLQGGGGRGCSAPWALTGSLARLAHRCAAPRGRCMRRRITHARRGLQTPRTATAAPQGDRAAPRHAPRHPPRRCRALARQEPACFACSRSPVPAPAARWDEKHANDCRRPSPVCRERHACGNDLKSSLRGRR